MPDDDLPAAPPSPLSDLDAVLEKVWLARNIPGDRGALLDITEALVAEVRRLRGVVEEYRSHPLRMADESNRAWVEAAAYDRLERELAAAKALSDEFLRRVGLAAVAIAACDYGSCDGCGTRKQCVACGGENPEWWGPAFDPTDPEDAARMGHRPDCPVGKARAALGMK